METLRQISPLIIIETLTNSVVHHLEKILDNLPTLDQTGVNHPLHILNYHLQQLKGEHSLKGVLVHLTKDSKDRVAKMRKMQKVKATLDHLSSEHRTFRHWTMTKMRKVAGLVLKKKLITQPNLYLRTLEKMTVQEDLMEQSKQQNTEAMVGIIDAHLVMLTDSEDQ